MIGVDMYSDPRRHIPLENNSNLVLPAGPKVGFHMKPPTRDEIRRIVKKAETNLLLAQMEYLSCYIKNVPMF